MRHQVTGPEASARQRSHDRPPANEHARAATRTPAPLPNLQRLIGNRAVGRLLQAKLRVSRPGDAHEQEADRVAALVTAAQAPPPAGPPEISRAPQPGVQRACAKCEEEEEGKLDRKAAGSPAAPAQAAHAPAALGRLGGGEPLPASVRADFEPRFGYDFRDVRIHAGGEAAEAARSFDALAFTVGRDVVFAAGQFAPGSAEGRRLLAHELTHVVQQGRGGPVAGDERSAVPVNEPSREGVISRQAAPAAAPAVAAAPVPALNYNNLAERIHDAISGPGTDEEQVYLALQQLRRDPAAIQELERVYLNNYHVTLEADIRDDFSGEELEYALQLINRGTAGSAQAIGAPPSTASDIEQAARRLWAAVDIWGTDEEAIYAVLLPFNRDMRLIHELMRVYESLYRENLRERIISEMSFSELDYALYLLGGSAVRANVEIAEVTEAESVRLFNEMAGLTFWRTDDTQAPVPYHYPPDGCYARAHMITQRLTELGYASERVFAISTAPGGLEVASVFAADVPAAGPAPARDPMCFGTGYGTQANPTVRWWYHVAPVMHVRNAQGVVTEMVMDPSLANRPLTIQQWSGLTRNDAFARMSLGEVEQMLSANRGLFPSGQNIVYTADRDAFYPANTPSAESYDEMEKVRERLTRYSRLVAAHEMAAVMRLEMRNATIDLTRVLSVVHNATSDARMRLRRCFPNLLATFRGRLAPADVTRLDTEINLP